MISYSIKSIKMDTDLDGETLHQWKKREPKRRTRRRKARANAACRQR
jgi:hypothetical protein